MVKRDPRKSRDPAALSRRDEPCNEPIEEVENRAVSELRKLSPAIACSRLEPSAPRNLLVFEGLDDVARLQVLEVVEPDTALEARLDLPYVVLEPAERADLGRQRVEGRRSLGPG